jgi:hypothetical protein
MLPRTSQGKQTNRNRIPWPHGFYVSCLPIKIQTGRHAARQARTNSEPAFLTNMEEG